MVAPELNCTSSCLTICSSDSVIRRIDRAPVTPCQILLSQSSNCGFIQGSMPSPTDINTIDLQRGTPVTTSEVPPSLGCFFTACQHLETCTHRLYRLKLPAKSFVHHRCLSEKETQSREVLAS
jgi:hypothetical protein